MAIPVDPGVRLVEVNALGISFGVLLATACVGCEAILGFGETSMTPMYFDASSDTSAETSTDHASRDVPDDRGTSNDTNVDVADASAETDVSGTGVEASDATEDETADPTDAAREEADASTVPPVEAGDEASPQLPNDGNWSPLDLSGLVLWLDASIGVEAQGNVVTTWHDQSPFAHQASPAYATLAPTWVDRGIGGYPGVAFAGKGDLVVIKDDPSLRFGTNDFVIEVVMRHTTPLLNPDCTLGYGAVYNKQETPSPFRGPAVFANYAVGPKELPMLAVQTDRNTRAMTDPVDEPAYNDDVPRLVTMLRHADVLSLRINGSSINSTPIPIEPGKNLDAVGINVRIGAQANKQQCFRGVIAELVAAAPVTLSELDSLETYLLGKYAVALGPKEGGP